MSRTSLSLATLLALTASSSTALGAVIMSSSASAPTLTAFSQFNMLDDAVVPGGTTPGGGTYNSQAFSDNAGPAGQTFNTPGSFSAALPSYRLDSVSLKGAAASSANTGGIIAGVTWGVRISAVNGVNLVPVATAAAVPTVVGLTGNEWVTWTFTAPDAPTLLNSQQYAFEVFSSAGYFGFDATQSDTNYAAPGTAFNSAGAARSFAGNTTGNLANHGYDRTFVVGLTPAVVPEPATGLLAICGLIGLQASRRRR